jgi:hypothetical protein
MNRSAGELPRNQRIGRLLRKQLLVSPSGMVETSRLPCEGRLVGICQWIRFLHGLLGKELLFVLGAENGAEISRRCCRIP